MNSGSIGEIPPSTRGSPGVSAATATDARLTISPKIRQFGSIWKSQWERLFGSFQNITASITRLPPSANENLLLGVVRDLEACAAQHRLSRGAIGDPPVGVVSRVPLLDEVHLREIGPLKDLALGKRIVVFDRSGLRAPA